VVEWEGVAMMHIKELMLHNNRGSVLPDKDFINHVKVWRNVHPNEGVFGPIVKHTWQVDGHYFERSNPRNDGLNELPDASGFLLCEQVDRAKPAKPAAKAPNKSSSKVG